MMLHGILKDLPPSINKINSEFRNGKTKKAQEWIEKELKDLSDEEIERINLELAVKNYLLIKDGQNKLVLQDRGLAHALTYADRLKYYISNSNDKAQSIEKLSQFINHLYQFNFVSELSEKEEFHFMDIGAGDASLALPLLQLFNLKSKVQYTAVERDSKFAPYIEEKFHAARIDCKVYKNDFRNICHILTKNSPSIILFSHLYMSKILDFFPQIFKMLNKNGIIIFVHDTNISDATKFRSQFKEILRWGNNDYPKEITKAFEHFNLDSLTISYESSLSFPKISDDEWVRLYQIKQADYANTYSLYSHNFRTVKNLIDFVISDKLEAFNDVERKKILDNLKIRLMENDNKFKSICKIQIALSPEHTLQCKEKFLKLKETIEKQKFVSHAGKILEKKRSLKRKQYFDLPSHSPQNFSIPITHGPDSNIAKQKLLRAPGDNKISVSGRLNDDKNLLKANSKFNLLNLSFNPFSSFFFLPALPIDKKLSTQSLSCLTPNLILKQWVSDKKISRDNLSIKSIPHSIKVIHTHTQICKQEPQIYKSNVQIEDKIEHAEVYLDNPFDLIPMKQKIKMQEISGEINLFEKNSFFEFKHSFSSPKFTLFSKLEKEAQVMITKQERTTTFECKIEIEVWDKETKENITNAIFLDTLKENNPDYLNENGKIFFQIKGKIIYPYYKCSFHQSNDEDKVDIRKTPNCSLM